MTNIIKIITVFQILLICFFVLTHSSGRNKRNLLLAAFILAKALYITDNILLYYKAEILQFTPNLLFIGSSFQFLVGPALYFVIVETTRRNVVFKPIHLLHILPFLLHLGLTISQFHIHDLETKIRLIEAGFPYTQSWSTYIGTLNYLQFAVYGICALFVLSKAKEEINKISSQSVEWNIGFLKFLVYDFMVFWGVNVISGLLSFGSSWWSILSPLTVLNIFFIANAMVYQGLRFPQIYIDEIEKPKYEKNPLSEDEKQAYAKKLTEFMSQNKPYLNPTLSLADLAAQLSTTPHVLSQVLNVMLKQNFYDFINHYRIEESKLILSGNAGEQKTILEVLYQSGFNSKSVFNSVFRKKTGMTPSQFKRNFYLQSPIPTNIS